MKFPQYPYTAVGADAIQFALEAARDGEERVVMRYLKPDDTEPADRSFEPFELRNAREGTLVIGWDYGRGDFRTFRLDRVKAVTRDPMFADAANLSPLEVYEA